MQLQLLDTAPAVVLPARHSSGYPCCCLQVHPIDKQHIGRTWFPHELLAQLQNQMQQKAMAGTELERQLKLLQAALQMHQKDVLNPIIRSPVGKRAMHDIKTEYMYMSDF